MRKFLTVLLGLGLSFGLIACEDDATSTPGTEDKDDTTSTPDTDNGGTTTPDTDNGGNTTPDVDSDSDDLISAGTVAAALGSEVDAEVTVEGVISSFVYNSEGKCYTYLTDATGTIYIHALLDGEVGDHIIVNAKVTEYGGRKQLTNVVISSKVASNVSISTKAAMETDFGYVKSNVTNLGVNMFKVTCTVSIESGNYYLIDSEGNKFMNYSSGSDKTEFAFLDAYTESITVVVSVQGTTGSGIPRGQVLAIL